MNEEMFVVVVDTRAMSPAQIDGYEEYIYTQDFFGEHVLGNPRVRCTKSKVAKLCGLDMRIYFHEHLKSLPRILQERPEVTITGEQQDLYPLNAVVNGAATLLTFDPRTGFPEYKILGKAYVVVECGDYPLSNHQVWGVQDLISEARDLYHCDPEHMNRGRRQLARWCEDYRRREWGPLTIYEPRVDTDLTDLSLKKSVSFKDIEQYESCPKHVQEQHEYYSHRHFPNCGCEQCEVVRYYGQNKVLEEEVEERPKYRQKLIALQEPGVTTKRFPLSLIRRRGVAPCQA